MRNQISARSGPSKAYSLCVSSSFANRRTSASMRSARFSWSALASAVQPKKTAFSRPSACCFRSRAISATSFVRFAESAILDSCAIGGFTRCPCALGARQIGCEVQLPFQTSTVLWTEQAIGRPPDDVRPTTSCASGAHSWLRTSRMESFDSSGGVRGDDSIAPLCG